MIATVPSNTTAGSDLPNPWHRVAPPCPYAGHPAAVVYLWHPHPSDRLGRWVCISCGRRFECKCHRWTCPTCRAL